MKKPAILSKTTAIVLAILLSLVVTIGAVWAYIANGPADEATSATDENTDNATDHDSASPDHADRRDDGVVDDVETDDSTIALDLGDLVEVEGFYFSEGFDKTQTGAVNAAIHRVQDLYGGLDPEVVRIAAERYTTPDSPFGVDDLVKRMHTDRADIGLEPGDSSAGYAFAMNARMYQIQSVSDDEVDVLLLVNMSLSDAAGFRQSPVNVMHMPMVWTDEGWKVRAVWDQDDYADLIKQPDTFEAWQAGWRPIESYSYGRD
ncbi:hypothetical protein [Haloglycomyces albus]|uniref:hypothetical protein n=1 Tax=Haloglycomyces albus TaxID=526067 RepID=UPI00046D2A89|nr:hypothetical protein [Haloglycomyces albus]